MYKKKDDVHELVQALSNGEQRHFHHLYHTDSNVERPANFWSLYETMRSGKSQSSNLEMDARAQTSGKRLLYDNLLKSLRMLHENASVDISIQNLLTNVELLYNHSLADQAKLMIRHPHCVLKNQTSALAAC